MINNPPLIRVLMATYNGDRFLDEQLESLTGQNDVEIVVHVVDDGSQDGTLEILDKWKRKGLILEVAETNRVGSTRAFLHLLETVPTDTYVALCDQDDIWHPEKLIVSIDGLAGGIPSMVFSRRRYVDALGKATGISPSWRSKPSWQNAMIENIAYGNTQVMNREGLLLLRSLSSSGVTFYDSWIYLVFSCLGRSNFLSDPLIDYRLHDQNEVGLRSVRSLSKSFESIRAFKSQCELLIERAGDRLPDEVRSGMEQHVDALNQKSLILRYWSFRSSPAIRQSVTDNLVYRVLAPLAFVSE